VEFKYKENITANKVQYKLAAGFLHFLIFMIKQWKLQLQEPIPPF